MRCKGAVVKMRKTNFKVKNLILAAMFLALGLVLPFFTGQIPQVGKALSPMHIPVLLCGFICGWPWGLLVGAVSPLLRFLLFAMPPIFPTGIAMCFELAVYGAAAGFFSSRLPKKPLYTYVSLISAMFCGRLMWGTVNYVLSLIFGLDFTFSMFLTGAFVAALPGIICHIVLIPPIVLAAEHFSRPSLDKQPDLC